MLYPDPASFGRKKALTLENDVECCSIIDSRASLKINTFFRYTHKAIKRYMIKLKQALISQKENGGINENMDRVVVEDSQQNLVTSPFP